MTSVRGKIVVILWKCVILRKRNWVLSFFELISPILVVLLIYLTNMLTLSMAGEKTARKQHVNFKFIRTNQSSEHRFNPTFTQIYNSSITINDNESSYLAYAPKTAFTNQIMRNYKSFVEMSIPNQKLSVEAKRNEADLESALKEHLLPNSIYSYVLGVVFSDPIMTFKYKIIGNFDDFLDKTQSPYDRSVFFSLQVYLDAQFLKSVGVNHEDTKVLFGEFLHNKNLSQGEFERTAYLTMLYFYLTVAYTFLVTAVLRNTIQEKSSGIKELMRIMGLSSWMIWTHWFIYFMFIQIPVTVVITVLLAVASPHVFEANVFIVWFLFLLVTIDYIVIFFFVACFFDKATIRTVLCVLVWILISFALIAVILPHNHSYLVQVLISFIPLINLCWTLQSLDSFYLKNVDWDFSYLFTKGYTGSHISAGGAIVIFICEIILFIVLFAYLDAVKPGHYGVAKPVTFIMNLCQKKKQTPVSEMSSLPLDFELPPPGSKVGIGIRGLRKVFGVLKKVVAVENVNLDIYEGEVTVLLGHNGAGKTTTMSMITGMFSSSSGTIYVEDKNIYNNLYEFRQNLGFCTQHNLYFPKLTVIEHLVFFGMLKGRSRLQAKQEAEVLLYTLNLIDKKDFLGSELSGGMLRKLCLAVALTGDPKVLILDEPTSGLDLENRRHIWDIILSLRRERTILITTHYMEEADILGDRIAIMDHGKVVCCGTTKFLKKLYGTDGYSINVTKNPKASLNDITERVQRFIPQFKTKVVSTGQVYYSIKDEFVEKFPALFSNLEISMSRLGVTAISVSCTTMEDVFLRVAQLSEDQGQDCGELKGSSSLIQGDFNKVEGITLAVQQLEALVIKRAMYISKHFISTIIKLLIVCFLILSATLLTDNYKTKGKGESRNVSQREIDLNLSRHSIYPIIYDDSNTKTAKIAENIIKSVNGQVCMTKLENWSQYASFQTIHQPMNMLLTEIAHSTNTSKRIFLVSTFIENYFLIQYQTDLNPFAPSNAANLMANILLKLIYPDRSIEVIRQSLSSTSEKCGADVRLRYFLTVNFFIFFISCALTLVTSHFIPLIVEERVTGFKYQQIVAGASPLTIQLTSLLGDLCFYMVFIIICLVIIALFGKDVMPLSSENMKMFFLLLTLYGVSYSIFLYVFTYISENSAIITGLYVVLNLVSLLICTILHLIFHGTSNLLYIEIIFDAIICIHPTVAAVFALNSIANGIANDNICPLNKIESFLGLPTSSNRNSIIIEMLFLALDTIFYSLVIFLIDKKICTRMMYKQSGVNNDHGRNNDVAFETQRTRILKEVDTTLLKVDGLVKNYRSLKAVNQVSFLVSRGECFGLLGVDGAGKTTTFKMLAGEIFPSSGDAFCTNYSVVSQTKQYLTNIGYCPQFDALLDDLTGNHILTTIAKIRGVPRSKVRDQVDYWMTTLDIKEHANKRTKTYSGGTKRKLGIAMAFIGEPAVALLDEPTTGMDPTARRKVWSAVMDRQRLGYSAVLSSNSMEECEALCSRLTIMCQGEICCTGSVQELKNKFGQGYLVLLKLTITLDYQTQLESLMEEFLEAFPKSVIQDENIHMITYRVLDNTTLLSWLFSEVLRLKKKYEIVEDFIVSNAVLEQIFLAIARGQDICTGRPSETRPSQARPSRVQPSQVRPSKARPN